MKMNTKLMETTWLLINESILFNHLFRIQILSVLIKRVEN
jgi:hypothetical protein